MKKTFCVWLLVTAMALSMAACAADPSGETGTGSTPLPQKGTKPEVTTTTTTAAAPDFPETVLVDNEKILFKITAIENDPIWGYTLKAQIENRTDKDLMFSLNDASVNGFMCDPFFAVTVTAGMKANKDISFSTDSFEQIGIAQVTNITFELRVYDSQNIMDDEILEEDYTIYPAGQEADQDYTRVSQEGDIVLFDTADCAMVITGFRWDDIWGYCADVYLVNRTDDALMFSVGDAAVNGFMCNPYFATTVDEGKQAITSITWTKSSLEDNGITEIESLRLPIRVYDAEDWLGDDLVNNTFDVNP